MSSIDLDTRDSTAPRLAGNLTPATL
ncbi:MAG: hypothetical protein K0R85_1973, partial [Devosia sp.]|nr:hypothetical protein [Devosia sp.]